MSKMNASEARDQSTPVMDYEEAGKLAYAEDRVIVFYADPTMEKFSAHPDGSYARLSRTQRLPSSVEKEAGDGEKCNCGFKNYPHPHEWCSAVPAKPEAGDVLPPLDSRKDDFEVAKKENERLKGLLREKDIRLENPLFTYEVPDSCRKQRSAYEAGYESGWRGEKYNNPYTSVHHQDAYRLGFNTANHAVLLRLSKAVTGEQP